MSILKMVPSKSWSGDNRRQFFIDNANSEKYYYMPVGDIQNNPHRNTLVPLGTFLGFVNYRGQIEVPDNQNYDRYVMRFSNSPYNAENGNGAVGMDTHPLVYTEQPPAAGSVPLHYYDYVQLSNPQIFDENGRPTNNEQFSTIFGDGENGWGVQTLRPPGYETEQLRNSRIGAQNFVAKRGGKKTRTHKNRKSKKTRRRGKK
jgi:hypothetical protein